jgi:hypothetical protein
MLGDRSPWRRIFAATTRHRSAEPNVVEKLLRGSPIIAITRFVEERLDPDARRQVLEQLPAKVAAQLPKLHPNDFYPIEFSNVLLDGIASTVPDKVQAYATCVDVGRYIANDAINTFLRLLVKFLKPSLFARKFHDFFRKDHNFGQVETDLSMINERRFVLKMSGVEGYSYVSAASTGWMLHTLEAMGCQSVAIRETISPAPGPQDVDSYRFEVSWR